MTARRCVILALLVPSSALGATINVGSTRVYQTINAGISAAADGDLIQVDPGLYAEELVVWNRELEFAGTGGSGAVTIVSPDATGSNVVQVSDSEVSFRGFTIDGDYERRGMMVQSGADVWLDDLVFVNGTNADGFPGGALDIWWLSDVSATRVVFENNTAYVQMNPFGGHVAVESNSTFTVSVSATFTGGDATRGGGVYIDDTSSGDFYDAEFRNNHATGGGDNDGGAVCGEDGSYLQVVGSTFADNSAAPDSSSWGGAIFGGWVEVYSSDFTDNFGAYSGAALATDGGFLFGDGNTFIGNNAVFGGAVFCESPTYCSMNGSWFEDNTSQRGGAVMVSLGDADMNGNTFCHNSIPPAFTGPGVGDGGAVAVVAGGLTGRNNVFFENSAADGGAIAVLDSTVEMVNNHFVGNNAGRGGAVMLDQGANQSANYFTTNNLYGWNSDAVWRVAGSRISTYNHYFANGDGNDVALEPTDQGGIDPLLVSYQPGNCDPLLLMPTQGSPLINAGDPGIYDPDLSRSDIGAFGGPWADWERYQDNDGDGVIAMFDCDDTDASVTGPITYVYPDADGDAHGDYYDPGKLGCLDNTVVANNFDCYDNDPGAQLGPVWYLDADGDGLGFFATAMSACEQPSGWVSNGEDCNDMDASVGGVTPWYSDLDGDGFGDVDAEFYACVPLYNQVADSTDCDDSNAALNPNTIWYVDGDGDSFGDDATAVQQCLPPDPDNVLQGGDCDDSDPLVGGPTMQYQDNDGDGYGGMFGLAVPQCPGPGRVDNNLDCNDADPAINPDTVWYADTDRDGLGGNLAIVGCERPPNGVLIPGDCDDSDADVGGASTWFFDGDNDGFGAGAAVESCPAERYVEGDGDCDDDETSVYPGAEERCDDVDSDCDGDLADSNGIDSELVFRDRDGDGYGDLTTSLIGCALDGWVTDHTDCDDGDPGAYPGATEVWYDGIDQDCDQLSDFDQDLDGYEAAEFVEDGLDCVDTDAEINPDMRDVVDDGIDQNCDGVVATTWMVGGVSGCATAPGSAGWLAMLLVAFATRRRD